MQGAEQKLWGTEAACLVGPPLPPKNEISCGPDQLLTRCFMAAAEVGSDPAFLSKETLWHFHETPIAQGTRVDEDLVMVLMGGALKLLTPVGPSPGALNSRDPHDGGGGGCGCG
ncbi:hypothetical protein CB1_001451023 [Camelus ferus]|nr:hypothetical protein CB1_001451023 [Camelus ferus]